MFYGTQGDQMSSWRDFGDLVVDGLFLITSNNDLFVIPLIVYRNV